MTEYDIKRLALVLAVQAEIEGMKSHNQGDYFEKYSENDFINKANELIDLANKHDHQL